MLIASVPLRLSLLGGGSDLPAYLNSSADGLNHRIGCCLSMTIDKFVHVVYHERLGASGYMVNGQRVDHTSQLENLRAAKVLERYGRNVHDSRVEVNSFSDVPTEGTGLGGSSAFTIGLLACLSNWGDEIVGQLANPTPHVLAATAYDVEVNDCGDPIGKQDQYACAITGLNSYEFFGSGLFDSVHVEPLKEYVGPDRLRHLLADHLHLFYVGGQRAARDILSIQAVNLKHDPTVVRMTDKIADLARWGRMSLNDGNIKEFGRRVHDSWQLKRQLAPGITTDDIDETYREVVGSGIAWGGKLLGAGGCGYMLFVAPEENYGRIDDAMKGRGRRIHFKPFERTGCWVRDPVWDDSIGY